MAAGSTTWDERLEQLHGLEPGGFGGNYEDWVAALHPDDRAECLARVERALANPGPYLLLHRATWPDGSIHWIECRGRVTVDENGAPNGTIGVAIDVTDREQRRAVVAEQLEQERSIVTTLQHALLPTKLPTVPGISVAARYVPAVGPADIGGDWYAVIPLRGRALGLAIGDVAGHGLGAVADMANARFSVRALALNEPDPAKLLDHLDEVVRVFDANVLITALYGIIDPADRTWSYAAAGHIPALLRAPDGSTTFLDTRTGPPLNCRRDLPHRAGNARPWGHARALHRRARRAPARGDRRGPGPTRAGLRNGSGQSRGTLRPRLGGAARRRRRQGRRRDRRRRPGLRPFPTSPIRVRDSVLCDDGYATVGGPRR